MFEDKTLTCRDCGADFVFSAGEAKYFADRQLMNDPQRCPACRATRRQRQAGGAWPAVCAQCGQDTMLPFEPRTMRPVYCSPCYAQQRGR